METIDQETPLMASANEDSDFDDIRSTEFSRLGDSVYVDHAGAALYSESQLQTVFKASQSLQFYVHCLDEHAMALTLQYARVS